MISIPYVRLRFVQPQGLVGAVPKRGANSISLMSHFMLGNIFSMQPRRLSLRSWYLFLALLFKQAYSTCASHVSVDTWDVSDQTL